MVCLTCMKKETMKTGICPLTKGIGDTMAENKKATGIPEPLKAKYENIAGMIDAFCEEHLDGDYQYLCIHALQKLCRKKDSPMYKGRDNTWAAGIVYAIAQVTELVGNQRDLLRWRPKYEISAAQVAAAFGVSSGAMQGKAKEIREVLNITKQQEEWMTPEWRDNKSRKTFEEFRRYLGIR